MSTKKEKKSQYKRRKKRKGNPKEKP